MIPRAVEVLSLTALPKERIDSSGVVHNSAEFAGRSASVLHDISVFMKFHECLLLFEPLGSVFLDPVASGERIRPNERPRTNCCSFA